MEKFGAVIFLGLVMSTIAQRRQETTYLDQCQSIPEKSGFKKQQFFSGDWFMTHAKDATVDTLLCYKYTTLVNSEGKLEVQYRYFKKSEERKVICTQKDGNSQAPYIFKCVLIEGEEITYEYEVQHTIVETDGNSALLYRCLPVGYKYTDAFLVLNRQENGAVSREVQNALSTHNLDVNKFITRKNTVQRN
uniref:Procalin-like lipocalin 2 n=2 Tax=Rhodnius prolixus TaxID=13249 RepID=Q7YSZ9_RHOPR|nr:procalin-like lipocalin 2 precursor [Rhodnius prolixus]